MILDANQYLVTYGKEVWSIEAASHHDAAIHIVCRDGVLKHFFEQGKILIKIQDFKSCRIAVQTFGNYDKTWTLLENKKHWYNGAIYSKSVPLTEVEPEIESENPLINLRIEEVILRSYINKALDAGNKDLFMKLSEELNQLLVSQ